MYKHLDCSGNVYPHPSHEEAYCGKCGIEIVSGEQVYLDWDLEEEKCA